MPPSAIAQAHRAATTVPGATKRLTDQQERIASAWVALHASGLKPSHGETAQAAKVGGNEDSARVTVTRTLAMPNVRARVAELTREMIADGAPAVGAALLIMADKAKSERVRADLNMRLGETLGILAPQQQGGGQAPAVQINVVFSDPIAANQWQAGAAPAQVIDVQAVSETGHDLAKVGASAAAPQPAAKRAPKAAAKRKRGKKPKRGVGGAKRPRALAAGVSTRFSPVEVTEDVGPTDEGSGG